ncbi:MAG: UDP-N-acetylmuramoyl-tripeptide--D-alanyl-D-alanine ligase [Comamonadaceae bacterium]|nr:MAG: UDP-N-acetylmuramoyl-tripeptide--D-alanyl-D-alanine ligase [Comamonadaceae bacterium]
MFTLAELGAWLPGARLLGDASTPVLRVHTDTRSLRAGDLFVALKGERFDANAFLADAREQGAVAAVAHAGLADAGLPGFEVPDTLAALGAIAAGWRGRFDLPLIAVTGSNGKTTVTQMIASILQAATEGAALATAGNFNNEIGLPLTLLGLRAHHRLAVVELGMNHPGEIARLAAIARPTVALVNNAQREHQEFMASVEAVAVENAAVFDGLGADGTAVVPHGDAFSALWRERATATHPMRRCIDFGESSKADVSLIDAEWQGGAWRVHVATPLGPLRCALRIAGRHNVVNAMAAAACALGAGVSIADIERGLDGFRPVKGRSLASERETANGRVITLVDDTYNANPDSVRAAIDVLAALPGPRLLVLGDMGEVGDQGPQFHAEVGAYAHERGIECLFGFGSQAAHSVAACAGAGAEHFPDAESLLSAVLAQLPATSSVLVKGSRFMRMERVVQAVEAATQARDPLPSTPSQEPGHAA